MKNGLDKWFALFPALNASPPILTRLIEYLPLQLCSPGMSHESFGLAGGRTVFNELRVMDLGGGAAGLGALRLPQHTQGWGSNLTKDKAACVGRTFFGGCRKRKFPSRFAPGGGVGK